MAGILINKFNYVETPDTAFETDDLTYDVDSAIDFTNSKPKAFSFMGEYIKVSNWAELLSKFIGLAYELDTDRFNILAAEDYSIPKASRIYITNDERKISGKPKQIDNSGIYFELNLSVNNILSFIKHMLSKMELDTEDFSFNLSEVPFDINNERTWEEGMIPVAKLFFNLIVDLVEKDKITAEEMELLKTKEYTKTLFKATDYPAIANSRSDNMGNSTQKRYRAKEVNFNGTDIFVSTQFFDADRDAIIEWYKGHLD